MWLVLGLRWLRICLLGLAGPALILLEPSPLHATDPATARIEVPVYRHRLSNGDVRFTVITQIGGGAPIEAMLDTGSFGLRAMARALTPTQYSPIGITRGYRYGSGVVLRGPLATAVVKIGGATTGNPIGIQVVTDVICAAAKPDCPASRVSLADYGIGGDGLAREGYDAILGISLRWSDAPGSAHNPLSAMGARRWVVLLPRPDDAAPGRLIINPTVGELVGFHPVHVSYLPTRVGGQHQVLDHEVPSCPDRPLEDQAACPVMMLDSGSGDGIAPFYAYAMLFDAGNGSIGVRRR